jgi:hypothetical protein
MPDLTELPAPRKGARAGYYPDPLGGRHARWWDGHAWTLTIWPLVPTDAPKSRALKPPTKVCPHCGAETETFAGNCPNCGRGYTRTSPWKIAAIAAGAFLLTVGGCGGCVALVAQDVEENSISRGEYSDVGLGTPQAAVESRFGEPYAEEEATGENCLYYQEDDFFSDREFAFCFNRGTLVRKFEYRGAD